MKRNQDPGLSQGVVDPTDYRIRSRGHQRSRVAMRLTAAITAAAAASTFVAACGGTSGPSKTGKGTPVAAASRVPGGTGGSPEAPTATPQPTEPAAKAKIGANCEQLAPMVFRSVGVDMGFTSEAQAASSSEDLPTSFSYEGTVGPACRWTGGVLSGSRLVILQRVENDPSGTMFNEIMTKKMSVGGQDIPLTDHHFTVDGMPGGSSNVPGNTDILVRNGAENVDFRLIISTHTDDPDAQHLTQIGPQLMGEMLSVAS